jgi:hypothetical protein
MSCLAEAPGWGRMRGSLTAAIPDGVPSVNVVDWKEEVVFGESSSSREADGVARTGMEARWGELEGSNGSGAQLAPGIKWEDGEIKCKSMWRQLVQRVGGRWEAGGGRREDGIPGIWWQV